MGSPRDCARPQRMRTRPAGRQEWLPPQRNTGPVVTRRVDRGELDAHLERQYTSESRRGFSVRKLIAITSLPGLGLREAGSRSPDDQSDDAAGDGHTPATSPSDPA